MKRIFACMFVVALMLAVATGASAASITLTAGATAGSPLGGHIPSTVGSNVFMGAAGTLFPANPTIGGYFGSTVNYSVAGAGSVTVEFFGGEAGFNDQFRWLGVTPPAFIHNGVPLTVIAPSLGAPLAVFGAPLAGSGVLPFDFLVQFLSGPPLGGPVNGANPLNTPGLPPNFFVACAPTLGGTPSAADPIGPPAPCTSGQIFVFLDDNGGSNDDDYDDYMVRITVSDQAVPEPASFALLGSALLGLGLVARRLRK